MKIWAKYKCYIAWWINWNWNNQDEWIFEIKTLTEKTCKLKQIKIWPFDFVSRFIKDKEKREITFKSIWNIKDFIKESFTKYDTWSWMPFVFEIYN